SFKALGGAYAVFRHLAAVIEAETRHSPNSAELLGGAYRALTRDVTVATATDGNHGRSVAWGARLFGCRSVVYLHATVSDGRHAAIAAYGAEVRRVMGNYDDAVRQCAADAAVEGWQVISDTSYEDYVEVPKTVMQGYGVLVGELLDQLSGDGPPSHFFVQGGVGGLAAAASASLWQALGPD